MIERKIDLIIKNITPISFCGREVMKKLELNGAYELPFEVEPISGEHDFRKCENCQKELKELTTILNDRFSGKEPNKGFPFCCPKHSNLIKYQQFNRNDFTHVPEMVARKIIYTKQHIINSCTLESWYKDITDYIDWVLESFGQMPADCGNPLFLDDYFRFTIHLIKNNIDVPSEKKAKILEYLNLFFEPEENLKTDLNILVSSYEKWIKIFPFELSYFSKLKPQFERQWPILAGKPEVNKYTGIAKAKMHTKSSLIDTLLNLTNDLLTQVNGLALHQKGLLTDPQKTKLDLIINERKLKLKQGYINKSKDEEKRYRQILKNWFSDEKKFIDEITPIIKALPPPQTDLKKPEFINNFDSVSTEQIFNHFKSGLVDSKMLTDDELNNYLKAAFEIKQPPNTLFSFKNSPTKERVMKVYYEYYKNIAGKPHGKQREYAGLLGNYFQGFNTNTVSSNFSKSVY